MYVAELYITDSLILQGMLFHLCRFRVDLREYIPISVSFITRCYPISCLPCSMESLICGKTCWLFIFYIFAHVTKYISLQQK